MALLHNVISFPLFVVVVVVVVAGVVFNFFKELNNTAVKYFLVKNSDIMK